MYLSGSSEVPLCGGGFDCGSVLGSRWSSVLGVPVSAGAVLVYASLLAVLRAEGRRRWLREALAMVLVGSAGWFVYVQAVELGTWCSWCMAEHAVGVVLGVCVWLLDGKGREVWDRVGSVGVGLSWVGVLVGVQVLGVGVAALDWRVEDGQWVEEGPADRLYEVPGGSAVLNRDAHPMLGDRDAEHVIIEVIDYKCPGCREMSAVLKSARGMMKHETAVLVVMAPSDAVCNKHLDATPSGYEGACGLARVAYAVWRFEPGSYERFHERTMEQGGEWSAEVALHSASYFLGESEWDIERWLVGESGAQIDAMIGRDIELARHLGVGKLPGLIVGGLDVRFVPKDPAALAELLDGILDETGGGR